MRCPTCPDTTLVMTERSGVEIDYCPTCRGVWLDRGELDKLIDRAAPSTPSTRPAPAAVAATRPVKYDDDDDDDRFKKKRKGFLGEIFDF